MARYYLYPAAGQTVLDEDGNTIPPQGVGPVTVVGDNYYDRLLTRGLLLRTDPLASGEVPAGPPGPVAFLSGLVTAALSSRAIRIDGEVIVTTGYAAAMDGGGWTWRGAMGVSAGADYDKINCSNGQWQLVHEPSYVEARWLGVGLGQGSDWLRIRRAVALVGVSGGVCQLPAGNFDVTGASATLLPENNTVIRGGGDSTNIRRTDTNVGIIDARGKTGVVIESMKLEHTAFRNFCVAVDFRDGNDCTLRDCTIALSEAVYAQVTPGSNTMHAVAAESGAGHLLEGNRIRYMQFKMAGAAGGRKTRVINNYFYKPVDFAISFVGVAAGPEPNPYLTDLHVVGNQIESPPATGSVYIGGDGENTGVEYLERIHIKDNHIFGSYSSGPTVNRTAIVVHLGNNTRDVQIVGNSVVNDQGTYEATTGIRVRSVNATGKVDGLLVADNNVDGCDHAGIYLDLQGKSVKVVNNTVRRCRGIYLWATQGDIYDAEVAGNSCKATGLYGIWYAANTGNIRSLRSHHNYTWDVFGSGADADNIGYKYEALTGKSLVATADHDEAGNELRTDMGYGAWMLGAGTVDVHFDRCNFHDLRNGFLRRTIGGGAGELAAGFATGDGNRGTGTVPQTTEVTARITDVSTASSADVKSPCAGRVVGIRSYLGAAITVANSAITTSIEPAAGGGFTGITDGGFTVAFSGSARGDRDQAVPTANYSVERAGTLRATTDGASTTTATLDVTFIIDKAAV